MNEKLEGLKIVTAHEMARIEALSIREGASAESYMLHAGREIALKVRAFAEKQNLPKVVTLLVGRGNNGGDALVAGEELLNMGFRVEAYLYKSGGFLSPLCQHFLSAFEGRWQNSFTPQGILVDGLLGSGFHGELSPEMQELIQNVNGSGHPILSIDVPSGLCGTTGRGKGAIQATVTLTLALPKLGFFIGEGFDHIGKIEMISFGLDPKYVGEAQAAGYLFREEAASKLLPPLRRSRHKYEAGYLLAIAGSPGMAGAAQLASLAALRSGAGIVRLYHPKGMEVELSSSPFELIRTPFEWSDKSSILEESKRATSGLIGPGLGKGDEKERWAQSLIHQLDLPLVIDADALFLLKTFPKGAILTPHHGEMKRLLKGVTPSPQEVQAFAEREAVTVVLKGAPTWIFHPQSDPLVLTRGDPGMATAGTGDLLTGMIAALLSQGVKGREAAALGVTLHSLAGEIAAREKSSYGVIASDLIDALPEAIRSIQ